MTVSSQTSTVTFVGNGVATAFPLPFRFFDNGDIRAYFIDSVTGAATQMVLGTDYTLIGAGEPEVDGNALSLLTTSVPLASMRGLYVERVMPQVQETDIVNQGQFFASTHEDVFDRMTMLIQQANANSAGAIRVAIGDPDPNRLAPAISRANLLLGFDSQGQPIAVAPVSGSAADLALLLANNVDPNKGAGMIGYNLATVKERLDQNLYVTANGLDQAAELSAALNSEKSVVLRGDILVASPVTSLADTCVLASNGASVKYIGAAGATHVIKFMPGHALIVGGKLTIDCDNKAGIGLSCRALPTAKLLSVDGVTSINCFQSAPSTMGAHGIQLVNDTTGQPDIVSVTRCVVNSVSRSTGDAPGSVCSGITACDGLTTIVTGNRVSNVLTGNGTVDADGIVVFSDLVGSSYQRSNSLIKSNTITDCAGRLVKLQTRGKAVVEDNLLEISNIALITAWRGIDSQIADADIRNNKFNFTGAWTGGSDLAVIQTHVQNTVDYTGQPSNHAIKGNVMNVAIGATRLVDGRAVMVLLDNVAIAAATVAVDVEDNWITYDGGINSATKACNIAFTLQCPDTWAVGATAAVKIRSNQVSATNFMERLGGALNTNLTGKLALLQISENVLLSEDVIPVLPWAAGDRYTSDLLIYGNAVGLRGGEVVAPFDFSRVKPGCEFNIGGGASSGYTNAPTSYTYGELRHSGAFIELDRGANIAKSNYSPAPGAAITWAYYTLQSD